MYGDDTSVMASGVIAAAAVSAAGSICVWEQQALQKAPLHTSMHEYGTERVPCSLPQQDLSLLHKTTPLLHNTIQSESGPCS